MNVVASVIFQHRIFLVLRPSLVISDLLQTVVAHSPSFMLMLFEQEVCKFLYSGTLSLLTLVWTTVVTGLI